MDDIDRANLIYLIRTPPAVLARWFPTLSPEDQAYALSLLYMGRLEFIDEEVDNDEEFAAAQQVIARIKSL